MEGSQKLSSSIAESVRQPLRIGILGAARIAPSAIVAPAHATGHRLVGIAARDLKRAETFAQQHQIERAYGSYQELIDDPEINVIYNALHNGAHAPWNLRALAAGKHVLTEKPSASNAEQSREVADFVRQGNQIFMEGFHYYYHPVMQRVLEIISSGEIGEITHVQSSLLIALPLEEDLRWQWNLAGGAMMDCGCYTLHAQRMISQLIGGGEPRVESAVAKTRYLNVDEAVDIRLQYPNGITGAASCNFDAQWDSPLKVFGDRGSIYATCFVVPSWDDRVIVNVDGKNRVEHLGTLSSYTYQLIALANAIDFGTKLVTDHEDAVINMDLIDAAYLVAGLPIRPRFEI